MFGVHIRKDFLWALLGQTLIDDGRPKGWTETKALQFIAYNKTVSIDDQAFAQMFCEGDWQGIKAEIPEFVTFIEDGL